MLWMRYQFDMCRLFTILLKEQHWRHMRERNTLQMEEREKGLRRSILVGMSTSLYGCCSVSLFAVVCVQIYLLSKYRHAHMCAAQIYVILRSIELWNAIRQHKSCSSEKSIVMRRRISYARCKHTHSIDSSQRENWWAGERAPNVTHTIVKTKYFLHRRSVNFRSSTNPVVVS